MKRAEIPKGKWQGHEHPNRDANGMWIFISCNGLKRIESRTEADARAMMLVDWIENKRVKP